VRESTPVPAAWLGGIAAAWIVVVAAVLASEATATDPGVVMPRWGEVARVALIASLGFMFLGAARRRSWTFGVSAIAGGLGMVLAYGCRVSGHHTGAWWLVELAAFAGLTGSSLIARRAVREEPASPDARVG
jgi:hypothetical protein